jgi:hypothetical protein
LPSLYAQVDNYASNVIDDIFFLLPLLEGLFDEGFSCLLRGVLLIEGLYDAHDIIICQEFPDAIRSNHYEFILIS